MALRKITEEEMNAQGVIAAPDILNGTPAQNKAIFDRMVRNLVAPAVNACAEAVDEVNANQEEWSKQEQTREINEGDRKTVEARRVEVEATRETNEAARKQAEGNRSLAEEQRAAAEQARREAEAIRQAKEQERDNAERGRAEDEATRRGSEENRTEAESKRAQAEGLRKQAETERKQAEEKRYAAETIRESNETNRKQAEVNRAEAEAGRVAAEQERVDTNNGIVAQATAAAKRAEDSAKEVMQAAKPPYIGENGNWFVWDGEEAAFVDSGFSAKGATPVRGKDYWTESDKKEIAEEASELVDVPEVVQETGESESAVMSQKAVTVALNGATKIVTQDSAPSDTSVLWIDPSDNTTDGNIEGALYQYVQKSAITEGYFWYFDSHVDLPYKYKYDNYSTVEPITLGAGTYYFSPLMVVYTWIKVGNGPVQQIDHYYSGATTAGFTMTIPETSTIWLGYHNPQVSAVTPYVVTGDAPLPVGEYFEGKEPQGLESIFDYGIFVESYIKNCELVANELTGDDIGNAKGHYTGVKMGGNVSKLMCKAKFFPNASVALVTTKLGSSMVTHVTFGSVHLVYGLGGCAVGVFDTRDHLRSIDYFAYTITAGEELAFGFDVDEETNTLTVYLPDGTTKTITDSAVSACNGQYAIWEHFSNTSEGNFASCRITKLYCRDANGEVLEDDFKRFDGAIGVAPTGQAYRQFTSHNGNSRDFK